MRSEHGSRAWIMAQAERIADAGESSPRLARDPVNQPMVNNWVEAIGDENPLYVDLEAAAASVHGELVAPSAMVQVWTMGGLNAERDPHDPLYALMAMLDEAGFTFVVATDSEQTYLRYLRPGEHVSVTTRLGSVVGPKKTGLGEGYFVTTKNTWYVGEENRRDHGCGALRHPPGPMCPACGATRRGYVVARGTGTVYSCVVHRHPPVPGRELPMPIALVELDEGVRMVGELTGVDTGEVEVGMPVEVSMARVDDELTLPAWRPATGAHR